MCGRLNVIDDPSVQQLMFELGITEPERKLNTARFKRATDAVTIIYQQHGQRIAEDAIWWLLLDKTELGFKPSKYTSFNTRYDKLTVPRSAGFIPFKQSRCVIVAKGFGETEYANKKPIHYYDMQAEHGQALAFGGLYKEWRHPQSGERQLSCSIITLPPHEKLKHIHSKAMPLILPQHDSLASINAWLDTCKPQQLNHLLQAHLPQNLIAQQIDKPSHYNPVGQTQFIAAD
ncbi:DUF159 family protein [Saccharobesus litoralis]|uniref:Abasic site processing protein n=1 Tax=Saccharobesus litoralis TaxID=2172099 RepID=A0A2S0VW44_9ALTE|nr:SOS response-associated peptidase family protein [Saccharobesus litoralis]AWB68439.1 DUF159 family protein [Saccharobesus litoralis]